MLAEMPERSRPRVPELVIVPPVRPLLVATDVTVPRLLVRHTPPTATHPPYGRLIPARVEVAVDDAYVNDTAPANDVEATLVNLFVPEKLLLSARSVDEAAPARDVRKPESLVSCDVASFCQKAAVPLVMRTVDEAPTPFKPVPPFAMVRAEPRVRDPMLARPDAVNAVVEAYGS